MAWLSVTICRPGPVSTRLKYRRRRFIRIAKATVRASLQDFVGKRVDGLTYQSTILVARDAMHRVSKRYAHLRK